VGFGFPDNWVETAPPDRAASMPSQDLDRSPNMREAECPFCERIVLVYEEPPRCPLCACPLDEDRMRPYVWPDEEPSPSD
jgi:hypothetical protein